MTDPARIMARLEELDESIAKRQNEYEKAASDKARYTRQWDKRMALETRQAKGSNADARKANALVAACELDDSSLYDKLTDAEALYDACRVAQRSEETRVGIGQSILKAQGRG